MMNPTTTEIEEIEMKSSTSTDENSPNGSINNSHSDVSKGELDQYDWLRGIGYEGQVPSIGDQRPVVISRPSSFGERPRLSFGDLLDSPSAPSSPESLQGIDKSHPFSPQRPQRKNDTSAAGSPPNRPSGELDDKDSMGENNITDASSSLRRPQQLFNVVMNAIKEHRINIPSTSEQIPGRDSAEHARNIPLQDLLDVALKIMEKHPQLASNGSALEILARKPDVVFDRVQPKLLTRIKNSIFRIMNMKVGLVEEDSDALKLLTVIWNEITKLPKSQIDNILRGPVVSISRDGRTQNIYPFRILFVAAEMGNTRFVIKLLQAHPRLIVSRNDELQTIFHVAVMNRHSDIHNLLYEIGARKDLILPLKDRDGNNMLHLLGKTSVKMRSKTFGASLLMQRELLWFKEIETMMQPALRQSRNNAGQTPYELFSEENKDLVVQGLKWMKDCMVVATLIVTVAFAVAFTVPGGYNQERGIPIFIHGSGFLAFVIADAISLFCSSTSLLVFLSILTSRHGQHDFMYALPTKLMIGLLTLLISVAAMMVTFSASFFVLYDNGLKWVPILIATFAAMPVFVFSILQIPLLVDMFRSMYDSRYLFKRNRHMLYNRNPRF